MIRPTTQIKELAVEMMNYLALYESRTDKDSAWPKLSNNTREIIRISTDMDARTGTTDPSKKGLLKRLADAFRGN